MSFSDLGLSEALLRALARAGYTTPTPIQSKAIPAVLEGRDLLAAAQTGTGKTAAFTLPLLQRLSTSRPAGRRMTRVLVLTPTRELAAQVTESVRTYGREVPVRSASVFGGVSMGPQTEALRRGADIVVATPGRLLDHLQQGHLDLSGVGTLVLDEADRMLDMGFIRDIQRIIKLLPAKRQNLLFSATFSDDIRALAKDLLHDPLEINVAPRNAPSDLVAQKVVFVEQSRKRAFLSWLIGKAEWTQALVFTRTKHGANRLCDQLNDDGLQSAALHGNKSQGARTKALADFKAGRVRVLVATDVAARGIDISLLPHVVNYDLPLVAGDYVHRIGRTGRAGTEGEALSLVGHDERHLLRDIQRLLKREIPVLKVEGFDLGAVAHAGSEAGTGHRRPASTQAPPRKHPRQRSHAQPARGANAKPQRNGAHPGSARHGRHKGASPARARAR
jgi:ATP-dependent RNA helicase RhlE